MSRIFGKPNNFPIKLNKEMKQALLVQLLFVIFLAPQACFVSTEEMIPTALSQL